MTDEATTRRAEAHRLGTLEAEQLDEALRALERRDRQILAAAPPPPPVGPTERDVEFERLTGAYRLALEDVARLDGFRSNVERSLPWRILQTVRRPFGRSW